MGKAVCKTACNKLVRGLPGFPGSSSTGGSGALQDRQLEVATGYSSTNILAGYQFLTIQSAIDYAAANLTPTTTNQVDLVIASGTYIEDVTLSPNIKLSGSGDPTAVTINGTVTIPATTAGSFGLANLTIVGLGNFTLAATSTLVIDATIFTNATIFSTTTAADSEIYINDTNFFGGTQFNPMIARTVSTDRTVVVTGSTFRSTVDVGTTIAAGNVAVVNARATTFERAVTIGDATRVSILRANNCFFRIGGTIGTPTGALVSIRAGSKANLLGSQIPYTAVTGAGGAGGSGVADQSVIASTLISANGTSIFGFVANLITCAQNDTNYVVGLTLQGAVGTSTAAVVNSTNTSTTFAIADSGVKSYNVVISRVFSTI